jgi:TP901 family phage tail tape measure protein
MPPKSRPARVDLTVGREKLKRGLKDARSDLRTFGRDAAKAMGGGAGGGSGGGRVAVGPGGRVRGARGISDFSAARMAGGMFGGMLLDRAASGLVDAAGEVVDFERSLARFSINADRTPEQVAALRSELNQLSRDSGINRQQLLTGAAAYVTLTGDAEGATQGVKDFATVAQATGSSMEDLAAVAAAMKDNLGIDPKDFKAGFSALHVQGKAGAIELRELATLLAGIAPSYAQFKGGGGAEGLAEMGAALQVTRKGFGSSSEAATGLRAMMVALNRNADKFKRAGVQIYDKDPKTGAMRLRNFKDIVDAIGASKLAKNPTALTKAFGSDEAKRAYDQLVANAALYDDLIAKSKDKSAIDRDAAKYMESDAAKIDKAINSLKLTLAEVFTPERLKAFVQGLETVVELMGRIVGYIDSISGGRAGWMEEQVGNMQHQLGISAAHDATRLAMARSLARGQVMTPAQVAAHQKMAEAAQQDMFEGRGLVNPRDRAAIEGAASPGEAIAAMVRGRQADQQTVSTLLAKAMAAGKDAKDINITLKVGNDTLAKALAEANAHRTQPGGV